MIAQFAGLLMVASAPSASHDLGFMTAQTLADRCNSNAPADISYCYAFVTGVHDTMRAYEVWLNLKEFCAPADVMQADLRRIFLTYLSAYPELKTGQAASTVVVSFKTTFPCLVTPPLPSEEPKASKE